MLAGSTVSFMSSSLKKSPNLAKATNSVGQMIVGRHRIAASLKIADRHRVNTFLVQQMDDAKHGHDTCVSANVQKLAKVQAKHQPQHLQAKHQLQHRRRYQPKRLLQSGCMDHTSCPHTDRNVLTGGACDSLQLQVLTLSDMAE